MTTSGFKDQYGNSTGLTAGYRSGANASNDPAGSNIGPELGFGHVMGGFYDLFWPTVGSFSTPAPAAPALTANGDTGFHFSEVLRLVDAASRSARLILAIHRSFVPIETRITLQATFVRR